MAKKSKAKSRKRPNSRTSEQRRWNKLLSTNPEYEAARIALRKELRGCRSEGDEVDRHFDGYTRLDTSKVEKALMEYAGICFEIIATNEAVRLNHRHPKLTAVLTRAVKFVLSELKDIWASRDFNVRAKFEGDCLPAVRKFLLNQRDDTLIAALRKKGPQEEPKPQAEEQQQPSKPRLDDALNEVDKLAADVKPALAGSGPVVTPAKLATNPVPPDPLPQKLRGAPTKISSELKIEALAIKNSGGTNRDAAAKLYKVDNPTLKQVKSASKHLSLLRKKQRDSETNVAAPTE